MANGTDKHVSDPTQAGSLWPNLPDLSGDRVREFVDDDSTGKEDLPSVVVLAEPEDDSSTDRRLLRAVSSITITDLEALITGASQIHGATSSTLAHSPPVTKQQLSLLTTCDASPSAPIRTPSGGRVSSMARQMKSPPQSTEKTSFASTSESSPSMLGESRSQLQAPFPLEEFIEDLNDEAEFNEKASCRPGLEEPGRRKSLDIVPNAPKRISSLRNLMKCDQDSKAENDEDDIAEIELFVQTLNAQNHHGIRSPSSYGEPFRQKSLEMLPSLPQRPLLDDMDMLSPYDRFLQITETVCDRQMQYRRKSFDAIPALPFRRPQSDHRRSVQTAPEDDSDFCPSPFHKQKSFDTLPNPPKRRPPSNHQRSKDDSDDSSVESELDSSASQVRRMMVPLSSGEIDVGPMMKPDDHLAIRRHRSYDDVLHPMHLLRRSSFGAMPTSPSLRCRQVDDDYESESELEQSSHFESPALSGLGDGNDLNQTRPITRHRSFDVLPTQPNRRLELDLGNDGCLDILSGQPSRGSPQTHMQGMNHIIVEPSESDIDLPSIPGYKDDSQSQNEGSGPPLFIRRKSIDLKPALPRRRLLSDDSSMGNNEPNLMGFLRTTSPDDAPDDRILRRNSFDLVPFVPIRASSTLSDLFNLSDTMDISSDLDITGNAIPTMSTIRRMDPNRLLAMMQQDAPSSPSSVVVDEEKTSPSVDDAPGLPNHDTSLS